MLANHLPFINGKYTRVFGGETHTLVDPANSEPFANVSVCTPENISYAVESARNAFLKWSRLSAEQRAAALNRLAALIRRETHTLALIECRNVGKTLAQCEGEVLRGAENIEFFAGEILHQSDPIYYGEAKFLGNTVATQSAVKRVPVGVVGQITPWNSPFVLGTWNIAPALAYGNAVVLKPSLWAPLTLLQLGILANEAGIPEGVLNIVPGDVPASNALVRDPRVARIAFTGSDKVGWLIHKANAETRLAPVSLELGGKAANIVFKDANLDEAVTGVAWSIFRSQGQSCVAGSRVLIQQDIYDQFMARLVEVVAGIKIGHPLMDPDAQFGPVINQVHFDNVMRAIQKGVEQGAKLLCGGKRSERFPTGLFIEPTVFADVTPNMDLFQEEIFGPVLSVTAFDTETEAVALANKTRYGLSANIWTMNVSRALRVADDVRAGMKWVNGHFIRDLRAPFGGTKASGIGRQGADVSRNFYTEIEMTCMRF